jgi:hypothetical protein
MADLKQVSAKVGDTLTLTVHNADNQLLVFVNANLVYRRYTDNDPTFNDVVDLTHFINIGANYISIALINTGGPSHARFNLTLNGNSIKDIDYRAGEVWGLAVDPWTVTITGS